MQNDNSMADKILADLETIIYSDDNLKQFDIIPIVENDKNKSPILYEEHSIGLEMWCIKHIFTYIHSYLLKGKRHLRKSLLQSDTERVNRLLVGGVLIQPDISTFWNMRRELLEMNLINIDKELLLTSLVLSCKSKSNEAFAHRKWVIKKIFKNFSLDNYNMETLIEKELLVAKMASEKVKNNYHAWTHRIWLIENITDLELKSFIIKHEFKESFDWVFFNVSEHSGFHYRQRLLLYLKYISPNEDCFKDFQQYVIKYLHIKQYSADSLLKFLLGETTSKENEEYSSLICVLLFELLYTCQELDKSYPGHESIWCHRRFVVYTLLKVIYDFFGLNWVRSMNEFDDRNLGKNVNIINRLSNLAPSNNKESGEKSPKLFKTESGVINRTFLCQLLCKTETEFINNNSLNVIPIQANLANNHANWLKFILQINCYS